MTAAAPPEALTSKRLATAKARACLAGMQLHDLEGDDGQAMLVVSRWNLTRSFSGPDALQLVEAWLDFVGAPE